MQQINNIENHNCMTLLYDFIVKEKDAYHHRALIISINNNINFDDKNSRFDFKNDNFKRLIGVYLSGFYKDSR